MNAHSATTYRPDIDGLRAIAVMVVLLYHANVPGFSGGFVGVDIFFVISGYLITGILAREIGAGSFTLRRFYERRARRILPALLAVSAFVLAGTYWLYLPGDFETVAPSVIAAILFSSNVWFFTQTGYFQADAQSQPMLHSWSLGVEEQFYIILPLLLMALYRVSPRRKVQVIVALAGASFVWAVFKQADTDGFAFYMLPTRAWELLAGSLLALQVMPQLKKLWHREALCWAALAGIFWAVFTYDRSTPFPGIAAIPLVLGSVILIHCAPGTRVGTALSSRGAVFIGLISYSLYLWHWPVIVFWRYAQDAVLTGWQPGIAVALSLVLGWVSWRYIEQPFRNHTTFPAKRLFVTSATAAGLVIAVAGMLIAKGSWPERFDPQAVRYAAAIHDVSPVRDLCITDRAKGYDAACVLGAKVQPSALIWGDSHGVELAWAMGEQLHEHGLAIVQRTRASCPPALGYDSSRDPACRTFNEDVFAQLAQSKDITTVYLTAFWATDSYRDAGVDQHLDRTIDRLLQAGKRVVIIGPVPPQKSPVPRLLARHGTEAITATRYTFEGQTRWLSRHFPRWRSAGVHIVEPAVRLFNGDKSIIVADGRPLYFDAHHLSLAGAHYALAGTDWTDGIDKDGEADRNNRQQGPNGAGAAAGHR